VDQTHCSSPGTTVGFGVLDTEHRKSSCPPHTGSQSSGRTSALEFMAEPRCVRQRLPQPCEGITRRTTAEARNDRSGAAWLLKNSERRAAQASGHAWPLLAGQRPSDEGLKLTRCCPSRDGERSSRLSDRPQPDLRQQPQDSQCADFFWWRVGVRDGRGGPGTQ